MCVRVCVCVCVSSPEAMNNKWRDIDLLWLVEQVLVLLMGSTIDIIDGHGLSNETRREFLPKQIKLSLF